ncbi:MAG: transcriptional regulator [Hirschia sp.]|nr:transcriptional regulator [Hirschia sp.]MBF19700.1 transcriptional regulator [Hirschia sp.]
MPTYTISELAREFDITPRALRFYEDKDLLHPAREGLNRIYSQRDRARLQLILRGKRVGFSLSEIREMLDVYTMDSHYAQLTLTLNRFGDQIKKLERQREDIDAAVEVLREGIDWTRNRLKEMESAENDAEKSVEEFDRIARMSLDPEMADARTG